MKIYEITLKTGQRIRAEMHGGRLVDYRGIPIENYRINNLIKSVREIADLGVIGAACHRLLSLAN